MLNNTLLNLLQKFITNPPGRPSRRFAIDQVMEELQKLGWREPAGFSNMLDKSMDTFAEAVLVQSQKSQTRVYVKEVEAVQEARAKLNKMELCDITWIDGDGKEIQVEEETVEEFRFTGLANVNFIGELNACRKN